MTQDNTIVLSDEEKELLIETKRALYGDDAIPHGHVIGTALRRTLNDSQGTEVGDNE